MPRKGGRRWGSWVPFTPSTWHHSCVHTSLEYKFKMPRIVHTSLTFLLLPCVMYLFLLDCFTSETWYALANKNPPPPAFRLARLHSRKSAQIIKTCSFLHPNNDFFHQRISSPCIVRFICVCNRHYCCKAATDENGIINRKYGIRFSVHVWQFNYVLDMIFIMNIPEMRNFLIVRQQTM